MGFRSFIVASQEPCWGTVCWIQVWISPTGFLHLTTQRNVHHITKVPVIVKVSKNHWDYIPSEAVKRFSVPKNQVCLQHKFTSLRITSLPARFSLCICITLYEMVLRRIHYTWHITMLNWSVSLINSDGKYSQKGMWSVCYQHFNIVHGWIKETNYWTFFVTFPTMVKLGRWLPT